MKVIWIVNEYNGPYIGMRTRQIVLSQYLMEHGYEVYIIAGSSDYKGGPNYLTNEKIKQERFDGANFITIRTDDFHNSVMRVLVSLQFQHRLWKWRHMLPKPDVIISDFAGLFGSVFYRWKNEYKTKLIFDILDLWPELFVDMGHLKRKSIITNILYWMEHKSYRIADSVIFSFEGGKDYITEKGWSEENGGDIDLNKVGYLNNGVDLETVDRQKVEFMYNDADLDSCLFKVIYLGSISEFNGLDVLIEAAKILQDRGVNGIKILIYGYGNRETQLKAMADSYELKNVAFKGKVDREYAMNILSRGDLNVFTFRNTKLLKYGTSPNKLFMYFASAKPVLSMIKPGYDLVERRNAGISVDNEPEIIADAIIDFSKMDRDTYSMLCKNARMIAEDYDYKKLVNVMIDHIERN